MNQDTFSYNRLEPYISEETMYLHYDKLYQNYKKNFLNLVGKNITPMEAIKNIEQFPLEKRGSIIHNAGGVLNHELYFKELKKDGMHQPIGKLKEQILKQYNTEEEFKKQFIKTAKQLVGSGYTFLVLKYDNKLDIINLSNQETPYSYDMIPLINLDLWEHAYYLDYKTDKDQYINAFFDLIDFDVINQNYEQANKATQN